MKTSEVLQAVLTLEKYLDECLSNEKPKTNGDSIRTLSDEKLTKFLSGNCPGIFGGWLMHSDKCNGFDSCQECWLNWLKQECDT